MLVHNGALIMNLREPERILRALPQARMTTLRGVPVVVCKHTWEHVKVLHREGVKAPLPTLDWHYTGLYKPRDHQRKMVEFLIANLRAFNLSDMGVGKTAAALWAAEYLLQQGLVRRVLVVCPFSVMAVWEGELFNIVPHRSAVTLYGTKEKRQKLLAYKTQFCVTNFDGVNVLLEDVKVAGFDLIIVDEASAYKNARTQRFRKFREFVKTVARLWLLTATPAMRAPTDVWALIKLVNPTNYIGSFGSFRELTMRRIDQLRWVPRPEANDLIHKLMTPAIRFSKSECLDLPALTYVNRTCELTTGQKKAYTEMRRDMVLTREVGEKITAANAAVKLIKLVQICCGVIKDNDGKPHIVDDAARLTLLEDCIREAGNKAIVPVPFIGVMERLYNYLIKQGLRVAKVDGSVGYTARKEVFASFQVGNEVDVLLVHPKTAAHGLTLTNASTIIWYAPIFSAELYTQTNARIHRDGQTKACTVVHLGATPMEWKLYDALQDKIRMQDAILQQYEELTR